MYNAYMAKIELSTKHRILLEILLGQQRGSISEIEVFYDVKNKIKVEDRDAYLRQLPTGDVVIDELFASTAPVLSFEFEKEERKKLLELLSSHKGFTPSDLEWVLPFKKKLELI